MCILCAHTYLSSAVMEGGSGYDESYQVRQEDEVDVLQAVFPEGFVDLRKNDPWDVSYIYMRETMQLNSVI